METGETFSLSVGWQPMKGEDSATFRKYLRSLPYELLESVTEDYVWLAGLSFDRRRDTDFRRRRECCREECSRRGVPHLYQLAEETISPWAA